MKLNPLPAGSIQGDDKAMPMRGSRTGLTDTYGADTTADATNSKGRITGACKSDPMDKRRSDQQEGL